MSFWTIFQLVCVVILSALPVFVSAETNLSATVHPDFKHWKELCEKVPMNRVLRSDVKNVHLPSLPLRTFRPFDEVLDAFFQLSTNGPMAQAGIWVGQDTLPPGFFNTSEVYFEKKIPFQPFTQKLVLPEGAEVLVHGDFHGDIHSLITWLGWLNEQQYLDGFRLKRPGMHFLFLGDYTDRGVYGVEVLYTILRLKLANPANVHMVRGNHEDVSLATRYGFLLEGHTKYGREFNVRKVLRLYDFLPVAIYLGQGTNFLQCNHGGMEPGFDPGKLLDSSGDVRFQILGPLQQAGFLKANPAFLESLDMDSKRVAGSEFQDFRPDSPVAPTTLGFMWNDFSLVRGERQLAIDSGRALVFGDRATASILSASSTATSRVRAVLRAHQHSSLINPMMRRLKVSNGIFRHWQTNDSLQALDLPEERLSALERSESRSIPDSSVWTFNVSPDSAYGAGCGFNFDSFGILKVDKEFSRWSIRTVNIVVVPQK